MTGTNQSSVLPFGTLDTPGQGATVSGILTIFGWALTPFRTVADTARGEVPLAARLIGSIRLLLAVCLVPWLVPSSASGQSLAYVVTTSPVACGLLSPREPGPCSRGFISIVNTDTRQVEGTIELWPIASALVSVNDLTVSADGRRLYVAMNLNGGFTFPTASIWVFDTATRQRITTIDLGLGFGVRCAWATDFRHLLCSQNGRASGSLRVIDTETNLVETFPGGAFAADVVATPDGRYVYLLHGEQVAVLDASTYQQVATVPLPPSGGQMEITPDGSRAYVRLPNSLAEIDTATHVLIAEIPVADDRPRDIAFARGRAYVSTFDAATAAPSDVQMIQLSTRITTGSIATPATSLFASADEARIYSGGAAFLRVIDTALNRVVHEIPLDGIAGLIALTPPTPTAVITIDVPAENAVVSQPFEFGGWAADVRGFGGGPGVSTVHVWAYPANGGAPTFVGANYGRPRSDVAALFGSSYLNSGYQITVTGLPVGDYTLRASAYDLRTGDFSLVAHRRVTVAGGTPFGVVDTPAPGVSVAGTVLVTGWALSSDGVARVAIYRDPIAGETSQIWIGDATFVEGARPDVAAAFPGYPQNRRAGWGLAVLTNMLPNGGNGPITLHAYAYDINNNVTLLGSPTVIGTNQSSTLPFGTLDTPGQGATVSGILTIFGWALTPGPNIIPTNGSTIQVIVDGLVVGQPTYNQCRGTNGTNFPPPGTCNDDIATAFGLSYRNIAEGSGAIGSFQLDTTTMTNGIHTLAWRVTDSAGNAQGIGSRYFYVQNGG